MCNKLSELDARASGSMIANAGVLYLWAPGNADPNTLNVQASVHENGCQCGLAEKPRTHREPDVPRSTLCGCEQWWRQYVTITGCTLGGEPRDTQLWQPRQLLANNIVRDIFASGMALIDNNTTIENNTITDIALIPGLGESFWGYYGMYAVVKTM